MFNNMTTGKGTPVVDPRVRRPHGAGMGVQLREPAPLDAAPPSGAFSGFVACAVLVPGRNVGVFVATNRDADLLRLIGLMASVNMVAGIAPR